MSRYQCYQCSESFEEIKNIVHHLKNTHNVKDGATQIKCVNNFHTYTCVKTFLTFDGLRKHLNKCYSENKAEDEKVKEERKTLRCNGEKTIIIIFFFQIQ